MSNCTILFISNFFLGFKNVCSSLIYCHSIINCILTNLSHARKWSTVSSCIRQWSSFVVCRKGSCIPVTRRIAVFSSTHQCKCYSARDLLERVTAFSKSRLDINNQYLLLYGSNTTCERHLRSWPSGGRELFPSSTPGFDPLCACLSSP